MADYYSPTVVDPMIPLAAMLPIERLFLSQEAGERVAQMLQQTSDLQAEARRWLSPAQQAALQGTEDNIALLGEQMRRLHREQGGLQLN